MLEVHLWPLINAIVLSMSSISPWRQFLPSTAEMEAISVGLVLGQSMEHEYGGGRTAGAECMGLGKEDEKEGQDEQGIAARSQRGGHFGVMVMVRVD